jgi:branched-chain amino acid transport system permease protein
MDYYIHLGILVGIYLILAQSLNLTFGLGRLFNLAHVASYAIGAYATALLSTEAECGFWVCMGASILIAGLLAFLIGAISVRLSRDYFAIGTLAFAAVVSAFLINWKSLTHGVLGVSGIPRPVVLGYDTLENINFLAVTWIFAMVALATLYVLFRNSFARRMRAQAEFEQAALSLGCNTPAVRWWGFYLSSSFAGLAGCLFAFYLNYIDPSSFSFVEMVFVLTIAVVGRPGSFWGVVGATFFLVLLPEPLRFIEFSPGVLGPMRQMLYAVIMFAMVAWNRERLFPLARQV